MEGGGQALGRGKCSNERKSKKNVGEKTENGKTMMVWGWVAGTSKPETELRSAETRPNSNRHDGDGGPDMAEASRLPEVAKEMKRLPTTNPVLDFLSSPHLVPRQNFFPQESRSRAYNANARRNSSVGTSLQRNYELLATLRSLKDTFYLH